MLTRETRRKIKKSAFLSPVTSLLFGVSLIIASPFLIYTNFSFSAPSVYSSTLLFALGISMGLVCSLWPLVREIEPHLHSESTQKFLQLRGIPLLAVLGSVIFLESWLIFSVLTSGVGAILYPNAGSSVYLAFLLASMILVFPSLKVATTPDRRGSFMFLSVIMLILVAAFSFLESVTIERSSALAIRPYFSGVSEANLLLSLSLVSAAGCIVFFLLTQKGWRLTGPKAVESREQADSFSLYNFMFFFGIVNLFASLFFDIIYPLRYDSVNINSKVLVFLPGDLLQNISLILTFLGSIALVALGSIRRMTKLGANFVDSTFGVILSFAGIRGLSLSLGTLATNFSITSIALNGGQQLFSIIFGVILVANSVAGGTPILSTTLTLKPYAVQEPPDSDSAAGLILNNFEQNQRLLNRGRLS